MKTLFEHPDLCTAVVNWPSLCYSLACAKSLGSIFGRKLAYYRFVAYQWPWNRILALSMTSATNMTAPRGLSTDGTPSLVFLVAVWNWRNSERGRPGGLGSRRGVVFMVFYLRDVLGSNCINTFSRLRERMRRWQIKLPLIFSSFPWSREPNTDSPKPVMQNRWRFFRRCDTFGFLLLCLLFLVVRSQMEIMTCITSESVWPTQQ